MKPMSEMLAHKALEKEMVALPRLLSDLNNHNLRDTMAEVSLIAKLSISQTRTSLCDAISYRLTAHFGIPHGLACAFTIPAVLRHNLTAENERFHRLAKVLSPQGVGNTEMLLQHFDELNQLLQVTEQVREMVGSLDALITLREQIFTPGLADNALKNVN